MNILDPSTWASWADLAKSWQAIIAAIGATIAALLATAQWGRSAVRWIADRFRHDLTGPSEAPAIATRSDLRFVLADSQTFWSDATHGTETGTQVVGHWTVTNTSNRDVVLLKARIVGREPRHSVIFTREPASAVGRPKMFGHDFPILANTMSEVSVNFSFFPPIVDSGALHEDVVFTDNYGDEHLVREVVFQPTRRAASR